MAAGEQYEALQRGTIDAYASQVFEYTPSLSLYEVAPHTYDTGTGIFATVNTSINREVYDALPQDVKDVMAELSEEYDAQLAEIVAAESAAACDAILDAGGTVDVFPQELVGEWQTRVGDTIREGWAEQVGEGADAFFEEYTSAVASAQTDEYVSPTVECAARSEG